MQIFQVGGAVRDRLLGYEVADRDWVVVGAHADQLLQLGYTPVGKSFPVFLHPQTQEEYALARIERKNGVGYTGFDCYAQPDVTLEQDLLRRDLTINAIAEDQQGQLIDPYGGVADLKAKLLRHVSPAFSEDPLRVLRVARFAARFHVDGFQIAPETLRLMTQLSHSAELSELTAERIWKETEKALATRTPWIYFQVLRDCGALKALFPELDVLWGIPNPAKWHPEIDTGIHTLMVLRQAASLSDDICVRFAALVHDLGKGATPPALWPSHRGHEEIGAELIRTLCQRLRVPNPCRDLGMLVSRLHSRCHRADAAKPTTLLRLLEALDAWRKPQRLADFISVCQADFNGRTGFEHAPYPQGERLLRAYQATLTVDNRTLLEAGYQGPAFRDALHQARARAIRAELGQ